MRGDDARRTISVLRPLPGVMQTAKNLTAAPLSGIDTHGALTPAHAGDHHRFTGITP